MRLSLEKSHESGTGSLRPFSELGRKMSKFCIYIRPAGVAIQRACATRRFFKKDSLPDLKFYLMSVVKFLIFNVFDALNLEHTASLSTLESGE
jgi:hypothetical protein